MEKQIVKIGKYSLTKINKTTYEVENSKESLDFYFNANISKEIEVMVFDSFVSNCNIAYLGTFFSGTLEEAVKEAMDLTKDNVKNVVMWK